MPDAAQHDGGGGAGVLDLVPELAVVGAPVLLGIEEGQELARAGAADGGELVHGRGPAFGVDLVGGGDFDLPAHLLLGRGTGAEGGAGQEERGARKPCQAEVAEA